MDDVAFDDGNLNAGWTLLLQLSGGTPSDLVAVTGQLTFAPGETTKTILVPINTDVTDEGNETATVVLSSPVNAVLGDSVGLVTIVDDDGASIGSGILSPSPGATLSSSAAFTWTPGQNVYQTWLDVGTTPGGSNIYAASQGLGTSRTVTGIPSGGVPVYVRLWSQLPFGWVQADYEYVGGTSVPAGMLTPVGGSQFTSTSVTFTWTSGSGVSQIWLDVGSSVGGSQYYGATQGTGTSRTVTGLPTNGSPVYVRLWSLRAGSWSFTDYSYVSQLVAPAQMILPVAGATLPGATTTFRWTPGSSLTHIWLDIGTSPGGTNLYSQSQGTGVSRTVSGLPADGSPIYVRLWSLAGGSWMSSDYQFRASDPAIANMTGPAINSTFTSATVSFAWTNPGVSQIWLDVGTTPGGSQIYAATQGSGTSRTLFIPGNGAAVFARLWSLSGGTWKYIDYNFTAATLVPAGLTAPSGSTVSSPSQTFQWTPGSSVVNVYLEVGTTVGGSQIYGASQGSATSRTVNGIPSGTTIYVRLWSFLDGAWAFTDYSFTS
jgi:hypothetical protein